MYASTLVVSGNKIQQKDPPPSPKLWPSVEGLASGDLVGREPHSPVLLWVPFPGYTSGPGWAGSWRVGWRQMETILHSTQTYKGKNKLFLHFSRHQFIMFTLHIHPAVLGKLPLCDFRGLSKPRCLPTLQGWDVRLCACPSLVVLRPGLQLLGPRGPGPLELLSIPLEW